MTSYLPKNKLPSPSFASDKDVQLEIARRRLQDRGLLFPPEDDRDAPGWRGRTPQGEVFEGHPRTPQGPIGPGDSRDPWPTEEQWRSDTRDFIRALEALKRR